VKKVLAIPDLHFPWHSVDGLSAVYALIDKEKPDVIVQLGDLYDQFSFSKFSRSHDLLTPSEEISEGRECAMNLWTNIRKNCKRTTRLIQLLGNHDDRVAKRIAEKVPEIACLLQSSQNSLFKFPSVETILDSRHELMIDGVIYTHGFLASGKHVSYFQRSVVHGHTHRGGLYTLEQAGRTLFELDCGFLADRYAVPLRYTPTTTTRWNLGLGLIDSLGPRFIPLNNL